MKVVYPVVLTPIDEGLLVYVPDLDINTHGNNLPNAMEMARDAISIWCLCQEDEGRELPRPSELSAIRCNKGETATLIDSDISAYRRELDRQSMPIAVSA